jgi:hypothetical protein
MVPSPRCSSRRVLHHGCFPGPDSTLVQISANANDVRWDIPKGDPDYWPAGDRDNDGFACES